MKSLEDIEWDKAFELNKRKEAILKSKKILETSGTTKSNYDSKILDIEVSLDEVESCLKQIKTK